MDCGDKVTAFLYAPMLKAAALPPQSKLLLRGDVRGVVCLHIDR